MAEATPRPIAPANDNLHCRVAGCPHDGRVPVAGDGAGLIVMCAKHAIAWTRSGDCRDFAQHNSSRSLRLIKAWLHARAS